MSDYRGPYRDRLYRSGNDNDLLDRKRPGRVRLDRIGENEYAPDEYRSARPRPSRPRPEGHPPQRERVRLDRIGIDNAVETYRYPAESVADTGNARPEHKGGQSRKKTTTKKTTGKKKTRKKIVIKKNKKKKKKKPAAARSAAGSKKSIVALLLANWMMKRKKRSGQAAHKRKKAQSPSAASARRPMTPEEKEKRERIVKTAKIFSIVYCLIFVFFTITLLKVDILPQTMTCMILAVMAVLSLLLFPTLYFNVFKSTRKIIAMGVGGFLIAACLVLSFNLAGTSSFFSDITDADQQTEIYYVVSHRNSDVKKISDLKGKSVDMFNSGDDNYKKALKQLKSKENVSYERIGDLQDIGKRIVNKTQPAAVISSGHYEVICESDKNFQLNARRIYTIKVKMSQQDLSKNVNVTKEPYNIYLSGLDVNGNIDTTSRSDVNMIITVNPRTKKIVLTSIPRDCRIRLAGRKSSPPDKLTHTGIYGIAQTLKSVEELSGLDMNYYVKVNYSTVRKFINAIGGIDVVSDYEFDTHGQAHYHFKKGKIHLNGSEALAFARERKAFKDGDRQRNRNQAKIMEAIIKKATGSYTILTKYMQILDSCKKYIRINMTQSEIRRIIKMQISGGYKWNIKKQNITGENSFGKCYSTGSYNVYVLNPDKKSLNKAVGVIKEVENIG
jgi:LCP family protein required for cell wall assembly